jgi:hypothetical protein
MSFRHLYSHPRLPMWWRLTLFALDHDGMPLARGQLRDALDPERLSRGDEIGRAIRKAKREGMIEESSRSSLLRCRMGIRP